MHILNVFDHSIPLHSGYTFRSRAIVREQRRQGATTCQLTSPKHNLACLEMAGTIPPVEEVDGLSFYRTAPAGGLSGRIPVLNQFSIMKELQRRMEQVVAEESPDLIHAHSPVLNGLPAIKVGRDHGIPVVYEVRGFWEDAAVSHGTNREGDLRYRLSRALETRAFRNADAVTCICEGLRGDIVARGIPEEKVTIIPNAVDVDRFDAVGPRDAELARELKLTDKPVVGFIGSFYEYEGLDLLLEAVPLLRATLPEIQILLVGGGPMDTQLREQAKRLDICDCVHFIGRVPHEQVSRYYSLVDVFAYPRRSMRITELVTPLKPLEAMAQHCLVLASDVGGHRELIRDNETGVLFRKDDVHSLSTTLTDLFAQRERWPVLRAAGREYVERERSWQRSVARYRPVYESLLARRSAAA